MSGAQQEDSIWIAVWTASPQLTEAHKLPPPPFVDGRLAFVNATIRQTVRITADARFLRLRLSNAFGTSPLEVTYVTVAHPTEDPELQTICGSRNIRPDSLTRVLFGDQEAIAIPEGCCVVSDPFLLPTEARGIVSLTMYLQSGHHQTEVTSHPGSRTISWISPGNRTNDKSLEGVGIGEPHWYFISAVEALKPRDFGVFVIMGDSISDGRNSTDNYNDRWPDMLFDRVNEHPALRGRLSIVNQSLGGNRVLQHGVGPSAWSRIERDVLCLRNLKGVLLAVGVNDIGTAAPDEADRVADRLIMAYRQMAALIRSTGAHVFVATIPPFDGPPELELPYPNSQRLMARRKVNDWIRTWDSTDAVVDFGALLGDRENSDRIISQYGVGDYLHPNITGFRAMASSFPLDKLLSW